MKIKNIDNLEYIEYYMLILVSICFNVNGYIELYCIVELNVDDFIWKMILYMLMIEQSVIELIRIKFKYVFDEFEGFFIDVGIGNEMVEYFEYDIEIEKLIEEE